jgi:RND family efflux transporter MFP subunit
MSTVALVLVTAAVLAQPAGSPPAGRPQQAHLSHCVISLIDHVELPAEEEGILSELLAKEGMEVRQGQVLGHLDRTNVLVRMKAAEARLAVANEKATNDANVRVAKKLIELSRAEYEESVAINQRSRGAIPETQLRRQRVTQEKAELDAEAAEMEFRIAGLERKEAEAQIEAVENELQRREIKAPFDGVVLTLYRQQNEWVKPGEPVLRVVRMDRLRVESFLSADRYAPEEVDGASVQILLTLVGGEQRVLPATIDYVSPIVEASGNFRVWAEVDNPPGRGGYRWLMRPGGEAEMVITLKPAQIAALPDR